MTNGARDPIERTQGIENSPVDSSDCVGFELYAARVVVLFDGVDQTQDPVVDEIVDLNIRREVHGDSTGHILH